MTLTAGYENGFFNFEFKNFKGFIFNQKLRQATIINGYSNSDEQYSIVFQGFDLETTIGLIQKIENAR